MLYWEGLHNRKHAQCRCNIDLNISASRLVESTDRSPKTQRAAIICHLDTPMDRCEGCWVRERSSGEGQAGTLGTYKASVELSGQLV